jgi:multiple RNA-binding domain-containing protein 1
LKLKYTQDGVFRRFAFIGYANDEQAQRAIDKLNKSYIGTSKLVVEQCYDLNDGQRPRAWSKYSTSMPAAVKSHVEPTTKGKKKDGKSQLVDAILGDLKHDEKFKEFVQNVDSMKKSEQMIWNDTMKRTDDDRETTNEISTKSTDMTNMPLSSSSIDEKKIQRTRYLIKIIGIPYSSKENDIRQFFSPIHIVHCRLIHNRKTNALTGVCWVELQTEDDQKKALLKQKSILTIEKTGEHRYLELSPIIKNKHLLTSSNEHERKPLKIYQPIQESIGETGELFVRNLSYRVTEDDLEQLFRSFGQITSIHLPLDPLTKQPKGFAHVMFMFPEHAQRAFNQLDGHVFQGRLLHILPGKSQQNDDTSDSNRNQVS